MHPSVRSAQERVQATTFFDGDFQRMIGVCIDVVDAAQATYGYQRRRGIRETVLPLHVKTRDANRDAKQMGRNR